MALLPTISELTLVGVADRGVPNKERIVLRPMETVNVGEFALVVGVVSAEEGGFVPLPDMFFWPGNIEISPPSWLYVYTAPGTYNVSKITSTNHPVHVCHWGKKQVVFTHDSIQPALIRLGGIGFGGAGQTEAPLTEADWARFIAALTPPPPLPSIPVSSKPTSALLPPAPKTPPSSAGKPSIADMLKKKG